MSAIRPARRGRVFGVPLVIAALTAFGLLSALLGDGLWDVASWLAMGVVLAVVLRFALRR